jgi:hypothetical protein
MATESRLERRVRRDFPAPGSAQEVLRLLAELPHETGDAAHGTERVQAAIVLVAKGDLARFRQALASSRRDWRDVLVAADLADDGWPARLAHELGPDR